MIDLHMHTTYSDGTDNLIDILKKSEALGLEAISITDHDAVDAYSEFRNMDASKYYSGIIIPGVEIKSVFNGIPIEILGYNLDIEKFKNSVCVSKDRKMDIQNKYLKNFIEIGNKIGIKCDQSLEIKDNRNFAAITYYREITKYSENFKIIPDLLNDKEERFYRNTSGNKNSPFYIDESEDSLDINFLTEEIHRCGGKAFLPHLFEYKVENHLEFLKAILKTTNIDGIECYYSTFNEEQTKSLLDIAQIYNKYISGGSDYHGDNKKTIKLGVGEGNLEIPIDIIKDWIKN